MRIIIILLTIGTLWSCWIKTKDQHEIKSIHDSSSCLLEYDSVLRMSYYSKVDKDPSYADGLQEMSKILSKNIKYPNKDCPRIMDPKIFVGCIISADGRLVGRKILKGFPGDTICNANMDALKTVDYLTRWIPGQCEGKNVTSLFVIPIKYEWTGSE